MKTQTKIGEFTDWKGKQKRKRVHTKETIKSIEKQK